MQSSDWHELSQSLFRFFAARWTHSVAADLTQETLRRVIEKMHSGLVDSARGSLRVFAFGVAVNVRREHTKAQLRQNLRTVNGDTDVTDHHAGPEELLVLRRQVEHLKRSISKLSAAEQEVISLMVDSEMSVAEAARILGMPEGTIKSHMSRAKQELRRLMQQ